MADKIINLFGDKNTSDNSNYSMVLEDFIAPFIKEFPNDFELDDIFSFSIHAWNFALIQKVLPDNQPISNELESAPVKEKKLLNKMLNHKNKKFSKYDLFILDFELEAAPNGKIELQINIGDLDTYLNKVEDDDFLEGIDENDFLEDNMDYEEYPVDRHAIIVKAKAPFIEWVIQHDPSTKDDKFDDIDIYLVDNKMDSLDKHLKKKFDRYFIMKLEAYNTNKKMWPQKRNYKMFKQWFQVDVSDFVFDMEKKPVSKVYDV